MGTRVRCPHYQILGGLGLGREEAEPSSLVVDYHQHVTSRVGKVRWSRKSSQVWRWAFGTTCIQVKGLEGVHEVPQRQKIEYKACLRTKVWADASGRKKKSR